MMSTSPFVKDKPNKNKYFFSFNGLVYLRREVVKVVQGKKCPL